MGEQVPTQVGYWIGKAIAWLALIFVALLLVAGIKWAWEQLW